LYTYHYNANGYLEYIKRASDNSVIWQCNSIDPNGNITQYGLSAGAISVNKIFDENGYLTRIRTSAGATNKQWLGYEFDANIGDLLMRKDSLRSITETFGYDDFDQLIWAKTEGLDSMLMTYDDIGNITFKTGAGDYYYNPTRVHAVDSITGSQNMNRQNITYTFFNKPQYIANDTDSLVYTYNVADERIRAVHFNSSGQIIRTTWYSGTYEKVTEGAVTKHYYYISSPDGPVALAIGEGAGTPVIYYLCKDHLGSITGIMENDGDMLEEYSYDAWGTRRNPVDWSYSNVSAPTYTQYGFTGHEHLDMFELIHMNGRVYDPEIARFLSPDPVIQDPYSMLNYNRYTYCLNNPLKYVDPSGYKIAKKQEEMIWINARWLRYADPGQLITYNPFEFIKSSGGSQSSTRIGSRTLLLNGGKLLITIYCHDIRNLPYEYGEFQIKIYVTGKEYSEYNFIQSKYKNGFWIPDESYQSDHGFYYNREWRDYYRQDYYRYDRDNNKYADQFFNDSPNLRTKYQVTICGQKNNTWEAITTISWSYYVDETNKINHTVDPASPEIEHQENIDQTLQYWNSHEF